VKGGWKLLRESKGGGGTHVGGEKCLSSPSGRKKLPKTRRKIREKLRAFREIEKKVVEKETGRTLWGGNFEKGTVGCGGSKKEKGTKRAITLEGVTLGRREVSERKKTEGEKAGGDLKKKKKKGSKNLKRVSC